MPVEKDLCLLLQQVIQQFSKIEPKLEGRQFDDILQSKSPQILIHHITLMFKAFSSKVDLILREVKTTEEYCELEKVLQSQQAEIRNHIRLEQQMKLYAQSVQMKLEECEHSKAQMQSQLKTTISLLKKQNDKLHEECRLLRDRDLNTLSNYETSSKTNKVYLNRYDTENRRGATKQKLNSSASYLKYNQAMLNDLSKVVGTEQPNRSTSREDFSRKQFSKINSIQLLSKKGSVMHKK